MRSLATFYVQCFTVESEMLTGLHSFLKLRVHFQEHVTVDRTTFLVVV